MDTEITLSTDLYKTLDKLKPSVRKEYLTMNGHDYKAIITEYEKYKLQEYKNSKNKNKNKQKPVKLTKSFIDDAKDILDKPRQFTSVNFDTTGEPTPTFKYIDEWNDIEDREQYDAIPTEQTTFYPIQSIEPNDTAFLSQQPLMTAETNSEPFKDRKYYKDGEAYEIVGERFIKSYQEQKAEEAEQRVKELEQKATEAEYRIIETEQKAEDAEQRARDAEQRARDAEQKESKIIKDAYDAQNTIIKQANEEADRIIQQTYKDRQLILTEPQKSITQSEAICFDIDESDGLYHILIGKIFIDIDKKEKVFVIKEVSSGTETQLFKIKL